MIDVRKLYAKELETPWFHVYDYQPMIDAFGNVAVQVDDDDYQGDTRVLYDNDGKIGFLIFGWGSCSGCDALQACRDIDEVQELCNDLEGDIKWFDNKIDALKWAKEKAWDEEWFWHESEGKEFVEKIIKYLSQQIPKTTRYSPVEKGITMAKVDEVKKALDVCINQGFGSKCHECVYREYEGGFCIDALMKDALDVINQMEVVHGRWLKGTKSLSTGSIIVGHCCSVCDEFSVRNSNYCHNCGAKMMDGERKNNENECNA